jgi:hypothetical protein
VYDEAKWHHIPIIRDKPAKTTLYMHFPGYMKVYEYEEKDGNNVLKSSKKVDTRGWVA